MPVHNPGSSSSSSVKVKQVEVDFGTLPVAEAQFTITDPDVTISSHIVGAIAYEAPTDKDLDEMTMDSLDVKCGNGVGQFDMYIIGLDGYIADKFKVNYVVG